jgi:hypothetical protein
VLHLQKFVGGSLNMFSDWMTVRGPIKQRPQDQLVQRALQDRRSRQCLFLDRRHATLDERDGSHPTISS